jgi:hypothetical protein
MALDADVYRQANATEMVPAVLSWSFSKKKQNDLDILPVYF